MKYSEYENVTDNMKIATKVYGEVVSEYGSLYAMASDEGLTVTELIDSWWGDVTLDYNGEELRNYHNDIGAMAQALDNDSAECCDTGEFRQRFTDIIHLT